MAAFSQNNSWLLLPYCIILSSALAHCPAVKQNWLQPSTAHSVQYGVRSLPFIGFLSPCTHFKFSPQHQTITMPPPCLTDSINWVCISRMFLTQILCFLPIFYFYWSVWEKASVLEIGCLQVLLIEASNCDACEALVSDKSRDLYCTYWNTVTNKSCTRALGRSQTHIPAYNDECFVDWNH